MALRIGLGRHFLSDALASVVISALVALAAYRLLEVDRTRRQITRTALGKDLRALAADLGQAVSGAFRQIAGWFRSGKNTAGGN